MARLILFIIFFIIGINDNYAQTDSIIFKNGNFILGEIKSMNRNVLKVETDYSDSDFLIEWNGVKELYTSTFFLITLSNGSRYNGYLTSTGVDSVLIRTEDSLGFGVHAMDIVILEELDKGFWSQLYAAIDIGFDLTKANNFRQLSMRSNLGYKAKRWQLDGKYNTLSSVQDDAEDIKRIDGGVIFKYFLPDDWYPLASLEFLSNTEQNLDLRTSAKLGMGKYVIHTNKAYWGFSAGVNNNYETYTGDSISDRQSIEGFMASELNLFNMGDLSLQTKIIAYPSFTESNRWRADFDFNIKYDLPLDFYIKFGYTLNYDNQPAPETPKTDYILHSGFGWEW